MQPVFQTENFDGKPGSGNCLAASIASILHCRIEDIPSFRDSIFTWRQRISEFLAPLDLYLITLPYEMYRKYVQGYHLIVGKTGHKFLYKGNEFELTHCVVGYNGTIAHNPLRSNLANFVPFSIELFAKKNERQQL